MHIFFSLNKVKIIVLTLPFVFCSSGFSETVEYVCSYKKTIQTNPYDNKVHVEKNPKLANYKQNIILDLKTERVTRAYSCLLYTSPSPRDMRRSRMPSSA